MKILVTNIYSFDNKGDAAIVIALVSEIRRVFPSAEVYLQTVDVEHDEGKYGAPVSSSLLWILLSSLRDEPLFKRIYKLLFRTAGLISYLTCYKLLHLRLNWLLTRELKAFVAYTAQADLVIACGGGYLRTANTSPSMLLWLFVVCLNSLTGYYLGKPVYMYSQSIGPLNDWLARRMVTFTLNRARLVEVREDISLRYVEELKIRPPVIRTADPAFLLKGKAATKAPVELEPAPLQVGITVRNWFSTETQLIRYLEIMARLIDHLATKYEARVTYIPQVVATGFGDDDRLVAEKLQQMVQQKEKFKLLKDDFHPLELISLCSQMDIFIGTRMHSNIFALISDVPVVAIQYEHKTQGIMDRMGLGDATVDIEKINFEELKQKVEHVLSNGDLYKGLIKSNMVGQIRLSSSAMHIIKQDFDTTVSAGARAID